MIELTQRVYNYEQPCSFSLEGHSKTFSKKCWAWKQTYLGSKISSSIYQLYNLRQIKSLFRTSILPSTKKVNKILVWGYRKNEPNKKLIYKLYV